MRRMWLGLILVGSLISAACGPAQVVVTAEIEVPDPETEGAMMVAPLSNTEVQLFPFDRDVIFDSLASAFPTPEPPIPEDFLAAQVEIQAAQEEWRGAEAAWGAGRDRLIQINEEIEGYSTGEARYVALYREYEDVEAQVTRAERTKDRAFEAFTSLQGSYIQREDSLRFIREAWGDDAFESFWAVAAVKMDEVRQEILADTTDAQGIAGPIDVPPGVWWVFARHELPYSQLYWNIQITVERGSEPVQVHLDRANAQLRPKF